MNDDPFAAIVNSDNGAAAQAPDQTNTASPNPTAVNDPFASIVNNIDQQTSADNGSLMAGVDAINRQFEKMAIGTMKLGSYAIPGTSDFRAKLDNLNNYGNGSTVIGDQQATKDFNDHPYAYGIGATLGTIGSGIAYGNLAAGPTSAIASKIAPQLTAGLNTAFTDSPILARTAKGALAGGGFGIVQPTYGNNISDNLVNGAAGATLGTIANNIIPALKTIKDSVIGAENYKSSFTSRILSPSKAATQDVTATINPTLSINNPENKIGTVANLPSNTNVLDSNLQAFNKLGINPTPGQVTGSESMLGKEYKAANGLGIEGTQQLAFNQQESLNKLQNHIVTLVNNMAPDDTKNAANQLYGLLKDKTIAQDSTDSLLKNPTINNLMNQINKDDIVKTFNGDVTNVSQLPDNSLSKLDYIKQIIDDRLWNDNRVVDSANKLATNTKDALMTARNKILDTIDSQYGDVYVPARAAAQKVAIQNKYLDLLDKVKNTPGTIITTGDSMSGINYLDKTNNLLWGDNNKINQFLTDVKTVGGNTEAADAIVKVANQLAKTNVNKIIASNAGTLPDFLASGSKSSMAQRFILTLTDGRYQKALLDLTTSGDKWVPQIKQEIIKQTTPAAKAKGFMKLIINAANQLKSEPVKGNINANIGTTLTQPFVSNSSDNQ